jgi:hypothetical protein
MTRASKVPTAAMVFFNASISLRSSAHYKINIFGTAHRWKENTYICVDTPRSNGKDSGLVVLENKIPEETYGPPA